MRFKVGGFDGNYCRSKKKSFVEENGLTARNNWLTRVRTHDEIEDEVEGSAQGFGND
jgi:hypothetical protein